nr:hypothetical protein [Tanacetum cinerariifolium]
GRDGHEAGVVDHDVDFAEVLDGIFHQRGQIFPARDVDGVGRCFAACGFDVLDDDVHAVLTTCAEDDFGAEFGQMAGG